MSTHIASCSMLMIVAAMSGNLSDDIADVEILCGSKLSGGVTLRSLDNLPNDAKSRITPQMRGKEFTYDHSTRTIVIDRRFMSHKKLARTGDEIGKIFRLFIVHELVHAWQYDTKMIPSDAAGQNTIALCEGHAEWITEKVAERRGQRALFDRIAAARRAGPRFVLMGGNAWIDAMHVYDESVEFFRCLEANSIADPWRVVWACIPTEREICQPKLYVVRGARPEPFPETAVIEGSKPVGFVEFRRYLVLSGVVGRRQVEMTDGFVRAEQYRCDCGVVGVVSMRSEPLAQNLFGILATNLEQSGMWRKWLPRRMSDASPVGFDAIYHSTDDGVEKSGRRLAVKHRTLWEIQIADGSGLGCVKNVCVHKLLKQ